LAGYATVSGMGHLLGHARVSTTNQGPTSRSTSCSVLAATGVLAQTAGAHPDRPTLEQALDQLRPGDTLVVWKLDRLGRSVRHLVNTVIGLADRDVGFRSLQEAIDTHQGGRLVVHIFAALAEFERDLIRERTATWLVAVRARSRRGGRPSVLTVARVRWLSYLGCNFRANGCVQNREAEGCG
jgi:DNA invertase Pin-like site-specific DNA recombinase